MYYKIQPGITLLIGLVFLVTIARAQVAINTFGDEAHASAMLEVSSTDKGMLVPRMTTAQRTAILTPATGLLVFDTTTDSFWYYNGTSAEWQKVGGARHINELNDCIFDGSSIFLGEGAGVFDDGTMNANVGVGRLVLSSNTTGNENAAIGSYALAYNTTGYSNTASGRAALVYNTTGNYNTAIGSFALGFNTTGNLNIAIGFKSDYFNDGGIQNTIIGTEAGYGGIIHSNSGNIFLGYRAGYYEIGDNKLFIENSSSATPLIGGDFASDYVDINGDLNLSGSIKIEGGSPGANKVLTSDADGNATWETVNSGASELNDLSDAIYDGSSLFMGNGSGLSDNGSANYNTGIGINALRSNIGGYNNTATGYETLKNNTHGNNNSALGMWALRQNITGTNNVAVGSNSLYYNDSSSYNTAIGSNALRNTTSHYNTAVGYSSLKLNTDGSGNVSVGNSALNNNDNGNSNVAVGSKALESNILGDNNTVIGSYAGRYATGSGNILIGNSAGSGEPGSHKLYIENSSSSTPLIGGDFANDSLFFNAVVRITGGNPGINKVLTSDANGNATWEVSGSVSELNDLSDVIYDGSSLFLGTNAGINSNAALLNVGIGKYALESNTGGFMNTSTGVYSQRANTNGNNNTSYGHAALKSNSTGNYNTAVGSIALQNNLANENTAVGYAALSLNTNGTNNVGLGGNALKSNINGHYNTAVGFDALQANVSSLYNAAFGGRSLYKNLGERNTASGYYSIYNNTTGDYNTAIGYRTMYSNTTGSNNTALGYNCGPNGANFSNTTAVGNEATPTASNMVRIGNSSVTSIGGYVAWTNVSDQRFKSNIREDVSGLDFILSLRPVTYNLDAQKLNIFLGVEGQSTDQKAMSEKSAIRQSGFIAQEVEEVARQLGYEFSGIDAPKNENDHYGLRYAEFVVPLVKAVQEQQEIIEQLQKENSELKKLSQEIKDIKEILKNLEKEQ